MRRSRPSVVPRQRAHRRRARRPPRLLRAPLPARQSSPSQSGLCRRRLCPWDFRSPHGSGRQGRRCAPSCPGELVGLGTARPSSWQAKGLRQATGRCSAGGSVTPCPQACGEGLVALCCGVRLVALCRGAQTAAPAGGSVSRISFQARRFGRLSLEALTEAFWCC